MLSATLFLLCLGLGSAVMLAIASRVFYVWEDPKILEITDALPGANCGGCGYAGCSAAAEAVAKGEAPPDLCVAGGFDTALAVAAVMGKTVEEREPEIASTSCTYGVGQADPVYTYNGAHDCQAAVQLYGGSKLCPIGCIGLGSCVKACRFGAVVIGDDNLPVFNPDKCVACGACVEACPKNIIALTSATRRIIDEYKADECTAPCQRACPTGIAIPDYIAAIRDGDFEKALLIIKEKCPLPLICGRICPAPCELECRRNHVDEAVAINPLKRFAADYEMRTGRHINPYKCVDSGKRTAVIGGGAEGLTLSYNLARLGHQPTLIEGKPELGGILRYVISEDRLPRDVLDHDIQGILDMGVEARTNTMLGRDVTLSSLLDDGFDTVVLTKGGFDSYKVLHGGVEAKPPVEGLYTLFDFLEAQAAGSDLAVGKHVVVVHAGAQSLAVARKCLEKGAEKVTLVSNHSLSDHPKDIQDTSALAAEGIDVRSETLVAALGGIGERLTRLVLESTAPTASPEPEREVADVDTVILAAGRVPELVFGKVEGEGTRWQTVETFRTFPRQAGIGIASPAEVGRVSDSAAVVKSILSGRRLARAIHQHYTDETITPVPNAAVEADKILNTTQIQRVPESPRHELPAPEGEPGTTASWLCPTHPEGLSEDDARAEAARCLECGLICYKKEAV